MSDFAPRNDEQLLELLAGHSLNDLSLDEQREMSELPLDSVAELQLEFDRVAAAIVLADLNDQYLESLPSQLKDKILAAAQGYLTTRNTAKSNDNEDRNSLHSKPISTSIGRREVFAWLCVAASFLGLAGVWSWNHRSNSESLDVAAQRLQLLNEDAVAMQIAWAPGSSPFASPVTGDVVWSKTKQEGFLRFVGMPVNDPAVEQYQLWIIDPLRDDEPIDGGVFDISAAGEVIIPIDAKLRVISPAAFAITIEKPGGVVVSTQERLPLIAAVPS